MYMYMSWQPKNFARYHCPRDSTYVQVCELSMAVPGVRGGALRDVLGSGLLPVRRRTMPPELPEPTTWTEHENIWKLPISMAKSMDHNESSLPEWRDVSSARTNSKFRGTAWPPKLKHACWPFCSLSLVQTTCDCITRVYSCPLHWTSCQINKYAKFKSTQTF